MKRILSALLAVFIFVAAGGCLQYSVTMPDKIEYMGFAYGPSERVVPPADMLYFTGYSYEGMKLYADGMGEPEKVPVHLTARDASGNYYAYSRYVGPPAYAYTPYGRYNMGEPVTIGLMDEGAGKIELSNAAPYEVQKKEDGGWKTVFQPVAAQVITPLENGTSKEWTWRQEFSGGGSAGEGDYQAIINGQYTVNFTITKRTPVVRSESRDYGGRDADDTFMNVPEHAAFAEYYPNGASRDDVMGEMVFKAWMKGLPADKLHTALKSIMPAPGDAIPCLAVHAAFDGKPAWFIVVNWGMGGEKLNHIKYYAIDDETGKTVHYLSCK